MSDVKTTAVVELDRQASVEPRADAAEPIELPLQQPWTAALTRVPDGVALRVGQPGQTAAMEITIVLTDQGPVLRARAAALQLESDGDIVANCREFRLEAREAVSIKTQGPITVEGRRLDAVATHGSVRIKANDDVQLLGENVLLNCDRAASPPMPPWALAAPPATNVPVEEVSGDVALANELAAQKIDGDR